MKRSFMCLLIVLAGVLLISACGTLGSVGSMFGIEQKNFVFTSLPKNVADLNARPEVAMTTPYMTAALTVAVLCNYGDDPDATVEMLNVLKGPQPLSNRDIINLRDRLRGKAYKPFSFFDGATPQNDYRPIQPYRITVEEQSNSFKEENYATLYLKSGGADSSRPIKMRKQPSSGKWFLYEEFILPDIRTPNSMNPWN